MTLAMAERWAEVRDVFIQFCVKGCWQLLSYHRRDFWLLVRTNTLVDESNFCLFVFIVMSGNVFFFHAGTYTG